MKNLLHFSSPYSNGLFWGLLGGLLCLGLRFSPLPVAYSEIGMMLVIAMVLVASLLSFKPVGPEKRFAKTFLALLLCFMLVPLTAQAGLLLLLSEPVAPLSFLLPDLALLAFGLPLCAAISGIAFRLRKQKV